MECRDLSLIAHDTGLSMFQIFIDVSGMSGLMVAGNKYGNRFSCYFIRTVAKKLFS